jgi:hypothetical protein
MSKKKSPVKAKPAPKTFSLRYKTKQMGELVYFVLDAGTVEYCMTEKAWKVYEIREALYKKYGIVDELDKFEDALRDKIEDDRRNDED